jgi:3-polyprenyl-4-hydroxybenzoate decarboxylase
VEIRSSKETELVNHRPDRLAPRLTNGQTRRLVIGITGATGAPIGVAVLRALADIEAVYTHLVISRWGKATRSAHRDTHQPSLSHAMDICIEA